MFDKLQSIDRDEWVREIMAQDELFFKIYDHLPKEILFNRELLMARL